MSLVANLPCFRLSVEAPVGSYQRRPERLTKRLRTALASERHYDAPNNPHAFGDGSLTSIRLVGLPPRRHPGTG